MKTIKNYKHQKDTVLDKYMKVTEALQTNKWIKQGIKLLHIAIQLT